MISIERTKKLIQHLIDVAKIEKDEDTQIVLHTLNCAIDKNCVSALSDVCIDFLETQAIERAIREN